MSLRQGRFKKCSIDPYLLEEVAVTIYPRLKQCLELYYQQKITAAEMAALYVILFVKNTRKKLWLAGKMKSPLKLQKASYPLIELPKEILELSQYEQRKIAGRSILDLFCHNILSGIPLVVNQTLTAWHDGDLPLILLERIPLPKEVLEQQLKGERSVTMITKEKNLGQYVFGERDPLSFLIHDLQHAAKFYFHPKAYSSQVGFYRFIYPFMSDPKLLSLLQEDAQFKNEFEYAISDMNAYCLHLLKHINAAFREAEKETVGAKNIWFDYLNNEIKDGTLLKIFYHLYETNKLELEDALQVEHYFDQRSTDT